MNKSDLPGDAKHAFVQQRATPAASRTISIAMCTYNGDRFLREQSESILNQTRLPDHLIVCDDRSTDTTRSLLEQFARKSPFPVELRFNSRNLGVTRNFEQALMACRSDFIALCDQDDLWHPRKLERLTEVLEANPQAGFACSNAELIDHRGRTLPRTLWDVQKVNLPFLLEQSPGNRFDYLVRSNCVTGATMMLRKEILWKYLAPIPASWIHDHWLVLLCEVLNVTGCTTTEVLTKYRLHSGQTIGLKYHKWFPKRASVAEKKVRFEQRAQRYVDLLEHLQQRIVPEFPEAAIWINAVQCAQQKLDERVQQAEWPWWRREWYRRWDSNRRVA